MHGVSHLVGGVVELESHNAIEEIVSFRFVAYEFYVHFGIVEFKSDGRDLASDVVRMALPSGAIFQSDSSFAFVDHEEGWRPHFGIAENLSLV